MLNKKNREELIAHLGITEVAQIEFYQQLRERVLAHRYHQQETYQIDGTRYVLEYGHGDASERWHLWMYKEGASADFVTGDGLEEVFINAQLKGVPVEKLTLDRWHS